MSVSADRPTDQREEMARRLIGASRTKSFDPEIEVDWQAPLDPEKFYLPEKRVSLYGTPLWETMTPEQRIALSRHEVASMASVGIWFEVILMQLLTRHMYDQDPLTDHVRYGLVEIADECRHSVMFSRLIERLECPAYGPGATAHLLGRIMKTVSNGPATFAAILIAEEILDTIQRELAADDSVQPLTRKVSQIHVIEEARHVRYARDELERQMQTASAPQKALARWITARAAQVISGHLVHPGCYAAVGLDAGEAMRQAQASEQRRETLRWAAAKLVRFFGDVGLIKGPGVVLWKRSGLLA